MRVDVKGAIVPNSDKWIYEWLDMDATCPRDVQQAIDQAMGQPLDVYINSGGGDIFAGSEIYSALRGYTGDTRIHVVGLAASAASVIMCAGPSDITPTGMVMVHNVSSSARGDYSVMDHTSEILQKANRAIAAAYIAKIGKPEAEVLEMMDRETWLTGQEAVDAGLVDGITEAPVQLVAAYGATILPPETVKKIRNMIRDPLDDQADFLVQKARAELALLNMGGLK